MQIQSNNNNDYAFEALLQSQRELLSQMKYGTPLKWGANSANTLQATNHHHEGSFEKLVFNRRSSLDKLFPSNNKRKSLGGGGTNDTYELPSLDHLDLKQSRKSKSSADPKKRKVIVTPCKSSTGLLGNVDDDLPAKPDLSESSERSFELDFELLDFTESSSLIHDEEEDQDEDDEESSSLDKTDKLEQQMESTLVTEAETDDDDEDVETLQDDEQLESAVKYGPEQVQKIVHAFRAAMDRSQYTQQSIHDWDKRMGLKRSHSKTMRLSARSRKKLRAMFKREFTVSVMA